MNALAAFSDSYNLLEGLAQDRAKRQAGNALAQGDYQGASGALLGRGMLDEGMGVQRLQQGQQERMAQQDQQRAEQERAAAGERVGFLMRATKTLRGVPAEQRATVLQSQILPAMANLPGFDPQILSQLASADLSDDSLDVFSQSLGAEAEKYQLFNTKGGIVGVQGGEARMIYEAPQEPEGPEYVEGPDGIYERTPQGWKKVANFGPAPRAPQRSGGGSAAPAAAPAARSYGSGAEPEW